MRVSNKIDGDANFLAEQMQSFFKLAWGFHGVNRHKSFIAYEDLTALVAACRFCFASSEHSISIKGTVDTSVPEHSVIG
jgi:hypothetical protein